MPELPEVEVLVRHLAPLLQQKRIQAIEVRRAKVLRPTLATQFNRTLRGARFLSVSRRGKYLLFRLRTRGSSNQVTMLGHLGMTGRIYLQPTSAELPTHAVVVFNLGKLNCVFEDTRYFGRLTLELAPLRALGPEPLTSDFTTDYLADALRRSAQAIKVKLLDQRLVAGVGNIYASEALFGARVSPLKPARRLTRAEVERLRRSIRKVLQEAIDFGSTVPLDWPRAARRDGLFYYGRSEDAADYYAERLRVYDREGQPCPNCGTPIRRIVQAARSTYFCPSCQPLHGGAVFGGVNAASQHPGERLSYVPCRASDKQPRGLSCRRR